MEKLRSQVEEISSIEHYEEKGGREVSEVEGFVALDKGQSGGH